MVQPNSEEIVHEAAKKGIKNLVDILSTTISTQAKRQRLRSITEDINIAINESLEAECIS